MLDSRIWAEPFRNTVEGRPFPFSFQIIGGQPVLCADQPIMQGAKSNPDLITELLESDIHLTKGLREMISGWIKPDGNSALCFKQFKRRKSGGNPSWGSFNTEIGIFVEERIEQGQKYESINAEACSVFGKGRTSVTGAYSKLKVVRDIERKICSFANH